MSHLPFSQLPQDVLLEVSQYGNVAPSLNPEYIRSVVSSIDPNFPWYQELILEMEKRDNPLYHLLSGRYPGMRAIRTHEEDPNTLIIEGNLPLISQFLDRLDIDYIINPVDNTVVAHVPNHLLQQLDQAEHMINIRPIINSQIDIYSSIPQEYDYLTDKILRTTRESLREYFNRIPSDEEIIQAILRINPKYDLGSLLQWLRYRRDVCSSIRDTLALNMINLFKNDIVSIEGQQWAPNRAPILYVRTRTNGDLARVTDYLQKRGASTLIRQRTADLPGTEVYWVRTFNIPGTNTPGNVENAVNVVESISTDFTLARLCHEYYAPM